MALQFSIWPAGVSDVRALDPVRDSGDDVSARK